MQESGEKELYHDLDAIAERLSLQRAEVYRRVKDGALKAEKHERRLRFAESELQRYEKAQAEDRASLQEALGQWLSFFAGRLAERGETGLPEVAEKPVPEQVAELGRRIVLDAILAGATDLYLDPLHEGDRLLFGQQGHRREIARFPTRLAAPLKAWCRGLAPLPAAEAGRLPQALGRQVHAEKTHPFRLSAVPTLLGEHLHLHFFVDAQTRGLAALGYTPEQIGALETLLEGRPGLLLLAAPPDPGAAHHRLELARHLGRNGRLVVALEHRVQHRAEELVQLEVAHAGGADFPTLWQAALDMAPDALVVDEVRQPEQVRALLEGVSGGALVVAQVRATSALDGLRHLFRLEAERQILARCLLGVVERLALRRLCPHCRRERPLEESEAGRLGVPAGTPAGAPASCQHCGDGFLGRRPVHGLWPLDGALAAWIRAAEAPAEPGPPAELSLARALRSAVLAREVSPAEALPLLGG